MLEITWSFSCDSQGCDVAVDIEQTTNYGIHIYLPLLPDGWKQAHEGPGKERLYCPAHGAMR